MQRKIDVQDNPLFLVDKHKKDLASLRVYNGIRKKGLEIMTIDQYVSQAQDKNISLVDVRPSILYNEGHIPGAINIPFNQVETASITPGSYLYCVSGYHAGIAQEILAKRGIETTNIGGMKSYTGPVQKS